MKTLKFQLFDYKVALVLDDYLTLINGDSGIGKTLLFNYFERQSLINSSYVCFNSKYVERMKKENYCKGILKELRSIKNSLIVIDNAETILDDDIRNYIVFDKNNTYMIFGRNVSGLWITENNIASLVRVPEKKEIYLDYYFKDVNKK